MLRNKGDNTKEETAMTQGGTPAGEVVEEEEQNEAWAMSGLPRKTLSTVARFTVNDVMPASAQTCGAAARMALKALGMDLEHVLWATCTCPDEINRAQEWEWAKMTFTLGGLGGLPAVGKTGLKACASHGSCTSEKACIFVFVASHTGIDCKGSIGSVQRTCQKCPSGSCGAAKLALQHAHESHDDNKSRETDPDDVQMDECRHVVAEAVNFIGHDQAKLAECMYAASFNKLCRLVPGHLNQALPVVVLGGIQLNTDSGFSDFFAPRHFVLFKAQDKLSHDCMHLFAQQLNALVSSSSPPPL